MAANHSDIVQAMQARILELLAGEVRAFVGWSCWVGLGGWCGCCLLTQSSAGNICLLFGFGSCYIDCMYS